MSTTLTNGLKLPDKGSVDWYSDMQNNYAILDGAVGTVADHTTALAGKAPAVHTHGKADITDLFNSANTWTELQSYTQSIKFKADLIIGAAPSSDLYGGFNFGNVGTNIGNITARVSSAGATYSRLYIGNKFTNGALDPNGTWKYTELQVGLRANGDKYLYTDGSWRNNLLPLANNTYDLGSSSYQWNNLYAKNYYYNGTAWGLDKANVWSNINSYQREIVINGDRNAYIAPMWSGVGSGIAFLSMDATKQFVFGQRTTDANNRSCYDATKGFLVIRVGEIGGDTTVSAIPFGTDTKLGDSTNKWKTLNGINPGALSLPDMSATGVDISGSIVPPSGETTINISGGINTYTATTNGWLCIVKAASACRYIKTVINSRLGQTTIVSGSISGSIYHCQPVPTGQTVSILLDADSQAGYFFYPCQGNV